VWVCETAVWNTEGCEERGGRTLVSRPTLVVKIKKSRNPLRAFKKNATEDKENIVLLPVVTR
jgi:hypothetical protein